MTQATDSARECITREFEQGGYLTEHLRLCKTPIEKILFREILQNIYLQGYLDRTLATLEERQSGTTKEG